MRRLLAAALPPIVIVAVFFLPFGGLGPWARSASILLAFALAAILGLRANESRPWRGGALLALPGVAVGLLLTLLGAMEPAHLLYGIGMASGAIAVSIAAAWSWAGRRRGLG